jgi:hypothetical protein
VIRIADSMALMRYLSLSRGKRAWKNLC